MWVKNMLSIKNLNVSVTNKKVLNNFNLDILDGSVHVIMGPNGIGKSTLSRVIMGDSNYKITNGDIFLDGESIKKMPVDMRSKKGIFLVMQYPLEIDGVSNQDFLRTAISSHEGKKVGLYDFINSHPSNLSGGMRQRAALIRTLATKPDILLLDEPFSALDYQTRLALSDDLCYTYLYQSFRSFICQDLFPINTRSGRSFADSASTS